MTRIPSWACKKFGEHGNTECPDCIRRFEAQGFKLAPSDRFPPRIRFQRGWLTLSSTHWFEASDSTVFIARDGRRTLAQTICGQICDVTITYVPVMGDLECTKCVRALGKVVAFASQDDADKPDAGGPSRGEASKASSAVRLYRGLKEPYDPDRPSRDPVSGTDFTDCPLTALSYATGSKGVVLVIDVDTTGRHVSEALWVGPRVKRYLVRQYQDFVVSVIPAKELRAQIRRKGVASTTDDYKAEVLTVYIEQRRDQE